MLKLVVGSSPVFLALTIAVGTVDGQETTRSQNTTRKPGTEITAIGCVVRNGSVDVDKGVRVLNIRPGALALTEARVTERGAGLGGAVPGTAAQDHDTGTVPERTIVGARSAASDTLAFALIGERAKTAETFVNQRVEIVGRFAAAASGGVDQPRGTSGTTPAHAGDAHPSADLQQLEVISIRGVTGGCR